MILPNTFLYLVSKDSKVLNLQQAVTDAKVFHVGHQLVTIFLNNTAYSKEVECVVADSVEGRDALLGPAWENGYVSHRAKAQMSTLNKFENAVEWNGTVVGPNENSPIPYVDLGIDVHQKAKDITYNLSPINLEKFKKIHDQCLTNGVVAEVPKDVNTNDLTPMMPVLRNKDDGSARLCLNGNELRNITYPLPCTIDPLVTLKNIRKGNVYSSFDMSSFFFQIPVLPDQAYRQCYTINGKYYYLKGIMQGARNGSAVADKLLKEIITELGIVDHSVYVDDVLLSKSSLEDCVVDLDKILERFQQLGLRINGYKFIIATRNPVLLNHAIRPEYMKPGIKYRRLINNLNTVAKYATLGYSLNYFVKSVVGLQDVLLDIRRTVVEEGGDKSTKQPSPLLSKLGSKAIDLVADSEIHILDYNAEVDILTDWSKFGSGIVLAQNGRPWLVHSVKHNVTMSSLPAPIGELCTVAQALNTLYKFIKGLRLRLKTDALAVKKAMENVKSNKISMYANYIVAVILEHNIEFEYIKGQDNPADVFSRIIGNSIENSIYVNPVAYVAKSTSDDLQILKEIHNLYHGGLESFKFLASEYSKENKLHYNINDLKNIINKCEGCKYTLTLPCRTPFKARTNKEPFTFHLDSSFLGRWNDTNYYITTLKSADYADTLLIPHRPIAENILELLLNNRELGIKKLVCDGGKEFDNYLIKNYTVQEDIELEILLQSLKTANGLVEVHHRILKDKLRPMIYLNDVPSTLELAKWIRTINNIHNHLPKKLRLTEDPTKPK